MSKLVKLIKDHPWDGHTLKAGVVMRVSDRAARQLCAPSSGRPVAEPCDVAELEAAKQERRHYAGLRQKQIDDENAKRLAVKAQRARAAGTMEEQLQRADLSPPAPAKPAPAKPAARRKATKGKRKK